MPDNAMADRPAEILAAYEHLAEVTARMRVAATGEDWDTVVALEAECAGVYELLTTLETGVHGDAVYLRRKAELICRLLEDDAVIRERVSGQLTRIWRMIDGQPRVARLNAAYGASGPGC